MNKIYKNGKNRVKTIKKQLQIAEGYARDRIFMNSLDTGWITNENPYPKKEYVQKKSRFLYTIRLSRWNGSHLRSDRPSNRKPQPTFIRTFPKRLRSLSLVI